MDISYKVFTGLMGDLDCMFTKGVFHATQFPLDNKLSDMLEKEGEEMDTYKKKIVQWTLQYVHSSHECGYKWRTSKKWLNRAVEDIAFSVMWELMVYKKLKSRFDKHIWKTAVLGEYGDTRGFIEFIILKLRKTKNIIKYDNEG
jgi:hypothetical protein